MSLGRCALPLGMGLFLALFGCSGVPTSAAAQEPIVVDSQGSDDGDGSAASPFRTLKRALEAAKPGDTVQLAAGDYTLAAGERWSYTPPEALTIRGNASSSTRLFGPAFEGGAGLVVAGALTVEQLELNGFATGIEQTAAGELTLHDVRMVACGAGVVVKDTAVGSSVQIADSKLSGGVFVDARESKLAIDATTIDATTSNAVVNFSGKQVDISGSTLLAGTTSFGISLRAGALSLSDTSISGGNYGIYQLAGSAHLRRSQVTNYGSIGLYFASGTLDLGTETEAGDNAFQDRGAGAFGLYVDTGTQPATASNTSFDGVTPEASVVQASTAEVAAPGAYFITPGQRLTFFRVPEP